MQTGLPEALADVLASYFRIEPFDNDREDAKRAVLYKLLRRDALHFVAIARNSDEKTLQTQAFTDHQVRRYARGGDTVQLASNLAASGKSRRRCFGCDQKSKPLEPHATRLSYQGETRLILYYYVCKPRCRME